MSPDRYFRPLNFTHDEEYTSILDDINAGTIGELRVLGISESDNHFQPRVKALIIDALLLANEKQKIFENNNFANDKKFWEQQLKHWQALSTNGVSKK